MWEEIIEDRIGGAPDVIPVNYFSIEYARKFVDANKTKELFDDFWCNFSQTPEERAYFKAHLQPLFKIKRAILETILINASQIVVKK